MAINNFQYEEIIREYDKIRDHHANEQSIRKEEILRKYPEYKQLEDKIIELSMEYASKSIELKIHANTTGNSDDFEAYKSEFHQQLLDIKIAKNRFLESKGYPKDYLDMEYDCNNCKDTGYIGQEKCPCFVKKQIELLYDFSRMKDILETNNFSNLSKEYYDDEGLVKFEKALTTSKNFISNFFTDYHNLLLYGTVGTGKTFLSGCVAKELLEKGASIIYISAISLFQTISNNIYSPSKDTYIMIYESLLNSDLLIIDDLGTETTTDFVRTHLFEILNERILRKKAVIISTNLTLDEIRERYSERILSRICENYELLPLSGIKDIRIQKKLSIS